MIELEHVSKTYSTSSGEIAALEDAAWSPVPLTQLQAWQAGVLRFQGERHGHVYLAGEQAAPPLDSSLL